MGLGGSTEWDGHSLVAPTDCFAYLSPREKESDLNMAPSSSVNIELLERTEEYVVAGWRRLMLLVWYDKVTVTGSERSRAIFDEWAEFQTGGAAFLVVVPSHRTAPPDEKTQETLRRLAQRPSRQLKGVATLLEAEGFIAASVRAIMSRLHLNDPGGAPNIFAKTTQAAAWAAALLKDPELTSHGLAEAIRLARGSDMAMGPAKHLL